MNLPHLTPILFAKEVIKKEENSLHVECQFPYPPTLAMVLEAAAQSSSGFASDDIKEGFLVAANSLVLHKKTDKTKFVIEIEKEMQMDSMSMFSFKTEDIASGKFTIYVK